MRHQDALALLVGVLLSIALVSSADAVSATSVTGSAVPVVMASSGPAQAVGREPVLPAGSAVPVVMASSGDHQQVVLSGDGYGNTRPFELTASVYSIKSTVEPDRRFHENVIVRLFPAADNRLPRHWLLINAVIPPGNHLLATDSYLYQVEPGWYYLNVSAPHAWTVTFTPTD